MIVRATALVGVVAISSGAALADPLNLVPRPFPDIACTQIDVSYNASLSSLLLSATGFAATYEDDGLPSTPARNIFGGVFLIDMHVTNAGAPAGGTLSIFGAIPDLSITNQLLLGGSLTDFGFTTTGAGRLEFVFGSLTGALAPAYLAQGSSAGVIMNNVSGFPHNFAVSWDNLNAGQAGTGSAVSDTGPVPAPGAAALLGLGMFALGRRRR